MIVVDKLGYSASAKPILHGVSFEVKEGGLLVVVGPNGSGKSTLLRCLSGWYSPSMGTISVDNLCTTKLSSPERARILSFLPQRPRLSESLPVIDVIVAARFRFKESHRQSRATALELMRSLKLEHLSTRDFNSLSGGEAQRVALACLRAQDAQLWLLDEPANHLDPAIQKQMYAELQREWQTGRTVVTVTHNLNLIMEAVPKAKYDSVQVIGLQEGRLMFDLALSDVSLATKMGELYGLPVQNLTAFEHEHLIFGRP